MLVPTSLDVWALFCFVIFRWQPRSINPIHHTRVAPFHSRFFADTCLVPAPSPCTIDTSSDGRDHVRRVLCFFLANGFFKTRPDAKKSSKVVACQVDATLYKECKGWMQEDGSLSPPTPDFITQFVLVRVDVHIPSGRLTTE